MDSATFKKYRRKNIAEMRNVTKEHLNEFKKNGKIVSANGVKISISEQDLKNGSPLIGDMIARNPKDHDDQWLVAYKYYTDNFELLDVPQSNFSNFDKLRDEAHNK